MAGLYSPQSLGINAPSGGFQKGGWYSGRQYWDGQFSDPGVINPNSNQQGAGKAVSGEVNKQSSVAQGKAPNAIDNYIAAGAPVDNSTLQTPTQPGQVQDHLNSYGTVIANALKGVDLSTANSNDILGAIVNENQPAPPNMSQTYGQLQTQYGLPALSTQLNDLNNKSRQIQQSVTNAAGTTEAQPGVTADVVAGRESEQQREAQMQLNDLNIQIQAVTDQISTANGAINTIMQFTQQDYQNAEQAYSDQFSKNMQVYSAFQSNKSQEQQVASSNLQIFANAIMSGQMNYSQLDPSTKTAIQSLELKSGLPLGTIESLHGSSGMKSIHTITDNGQVVGLDQNGNIVVENVASLKGSKTTTAQSKQQYQQEAQSDAGSGVTLQDLISIYNGYLSSQEIYDIYNQVNYYKKPPVQSQKQLESWGINTSSSSIATGQ